MKIFLCRSEFSTTVDRLFQFHESPEGFDSLVGAIPGIKVIKKPNSLLPGEVAILKVSILPGIYVKWIAEHVDYKKNSYFVDIQKKGPFLFFKHYHRFLEGEKPNSSILEDKIEFKVIGEPISHWFVQRILTQQFQARHKKTAESLQVTYQNLICQIL